MFVMERIRNSIKESLEREIRSKFSIKLSVLLEIPSGEHGDFAYPLYDLLKLLKKSPEEIGKKLIEDLRIDNVSKIELSGNYVNFYVDYTSISQAFIEEIWRKGKEALSFERKNKKVILEHTSANPTGPIHVGRARNPIIGDTIGRLMKKCGYDVEIQYYVNDAGKQSATLVYGYRNLKIETNEEKIDHRLVHYYQKANDLLENDEKVKMEIEKIMKEVEGGNKELIMENKEILGNVLKGIEKTLSRINVKFDNFFWETDLILDGSVKKVLELLHNELNEENGAYYINIPKDGKNEKVFLVRKDGTTLYFTRDIAYHLMKSEMGDILINVLGEDHKPHAEMLLYVLKKLKSEINLKNIFYSFVALPEGRMSTRKGRVVYLDDLLDEAVEKAREEILKRRSDMAESTIKILSESIGTGAVRFNILKIQNEKKLVFRWEEALNFEGDSSPFLQYSYARASSILRKEQWNGKFSKDFLKDPWEIALMKNLLKYTEVLQESCETLRPHKLAKYAIDLASIFNNFYTQCPVLKETEEIKNNRLALVHSFKLIMGDLLETMGIEHPEEI